MTQSPDITKLPGAPPIDFPCLVIVRPLPRLRDAVAALTAEQRMHTLTTSEVTVGIDIGRARRRKRPALADVAKQANKPGIARIDMKPDGTVVIITGKPEPAAPESPWPLDEFRTKETKQ